MSHAFVAAVVIEAIAIAALIICITAIAKAIGEEESDLTVGGMLVVAVALAAILIAGGYLISDTVPLETITAEVK